MHFILAGKFSLFEKKDCPNEGQSFLFLVCVFTERIRILIPFVPRRLCHHFDPHCLFEAFL